MNSSGNLDIVIYESNEPLFCLSDVAKTLGYSNPAKVVIDDCKGVTVLETPTQSGVQPIKYGKESAVYRLTMKSKLPDAEKFQDWVWKMSAQWIPLRKGEIDTFLFYSLILKTVRWLHIKIVNG